MIRWLLRKLGYVSIDYGFSCGRHWVAIDGKVIAQTSGDDFWLEDAQIRRMAIAVVPGCVWQAEAGDEWYIQVVKQRWPWHDHEELNAARRGEFRRQVFDQQGAVFGINRE